MERKAKAATETGIYLVVIAAILVVVNVIAFMGVHKRFDLTKNERFTLSQGSGRLIGSLKGPMQVEAYVTRGLAVMRQRNNIGLRALLDAASLSQPPTTYSLGFVLGPRINAGGLLALDDYVSGADGLAAQKVLQAAILSLETGTIVTGD